MNSAATNFSVERNPRTVGGGRHRSELAARTHPRQGWQDRREAAFSMSSGSPRSVYIQIKQHDLAPGRWPRTTMNQLPRLLDHTLLRPQTPIQHSVVDCFADVMYVNIRALFEICNRTGNTEYLVMGPRRKPEFVHARFEQAKAVVG